jgi:hypothetical protein
MANSNGWGDGAANNAIGWGQGANNNIGWGDSHTKSNAGLTDIVGITTDADASAFITAAAITNTLEQTAIDTLVKGLKTDGIWDKMKAIYPFVGGSASTHKFNLKDPRDLDAAFRLVFTGGWTHNVNGVTANGVNAYADTKYVPSVNNVLSDYSSLSIYSRTNSISVSPDIQIDMGVNQFSTPTGAFMLFTGYNSVNQLAGFQSDFPNAFTYGFYGSQGANTNTTGFYTGTANSVNNQVYKNGTLITQNTFAKVTTRTSPTIALFIGADNYNNNARRYSVKNYAFAHIGKSLTSTEVSNLNTRVQAFQTALSRNV